MVVCSERITGYLKSLEDETLKEYSIAEQARSKGLDPEDKVDIPLAVDVADRCEGLVGASVPEIVGTGISARIRELEKQYSSGDWRVALIIGAEVAKNKFFTFTSLEKAMEAGVRVGLAYITLGVTCAPLEGFIELKLKKRMDGAGDYCSIFFAGPIRAAGGTAAAVTALIADYIRRECGVKEYDVQPDELNRYYAECQDYDEKVSRLQYRPSEEELKFMVQKLPIELNGDPTSQLEVSNFKRLKRVETDLIRGGMCLVLCEGLCSKAKKMIVKIQKWGESMGLKYWMFLQDYVDLQKKINAALAKPKTDEPLSLVKVKPNAKFIEEIVAGRPVFSHPLSIGGFRLRYGRSRLSGLASASVHPATMRISDDFIATGVQLKVERPGKACAISPCDLISGPLVKLKNGEVLWLESEEDALKYRKDILEVLFIGDILFCFGDFMENGSMLVPPGYVEEWWREDLNKALTAKPLEEVQKKISVNIGAVLKDPLRIKVSLSDALILSKELNIPLYPKHVFFWKNISVNELKELVESLKKADLSKQILPLSVKPILEKIYLPHKVVGGELVLSKDVFDALLVNLGFDNGFKEIIGDNALDILNKISGLKLNDISGTFVGSRMGRPEKAKLRHMTGSPQGLFPVGDEGGRLRSFNAAS
ncbi:DNA polymerase II large subunit [Candidatus Tiddalikarchaeum anstoanum]|nr:DNA polymerase II large subunit [Candidatus Tiddalikarchaeum anstoanum]